MHCKLGTSNRKKKDFKTRLTFTSSFNRENDREILNLLKNLGFNFDSYFTTKRVRYYGNLYTDNESCTRFANCFIFNLSRSIYGIIFKIIIIDEEVYLACTRLKKISSVVTIEKFNLESSLIYCKKSSEINISLVSKRFSFENGNKAYFSTLTLGHVFT